MWPRLTWLMLAALLLAGLAGCGAVNRSPADARRELDAALARSARDAGVPGAASALVVGGRVVWLGGTGMADLSARRPMTARTPVWFASVGKMVTAAVALKLAEHGRLRLDDSVRRWVPEWRGPRAVTVRRLLSQTSGLRDPGDAFFQRQRRYPARRVTPRDWLESVPAPEPHPSDAPTYANVNYILAGLALRRAAGRRWAAVRHEVAPALVLQPEEQVRGTPARGYVYPNGGAPRAFGDRSRYLPPTSVASAAWATGAWAGTVEGLARWADRLFGGRILRRSSLDQMTEFHAGGALPAPWDEYGLGVARTRIEGHEVRGHGGDGPGLRCVLFYLPERRLTLFTLWNDDRFDGPDIQLALLRRCGDSRRCAAGLSRDRALVAGAVDVFVVCGSRRISDVLPARFCSDLRLNPLRAPTRPPRRLVAAVQDLGDLIHALGPRRGVAGGRAQIDVPQARGDLVDGNAGLEAPTGPLSAVRGS